jgi:hypothetical protein
MIWLSNYFPHCAIWLSKKNKPWFRFGLAILSHVADLTIHQMQITTMEKNEGGASKDHQLLFYWHLVPAAAASARGIHALPTNKDMFWLSKKIQDMIWLSNYFLHRAIWLSKKSLSKQRRCLTFQKYKPWFVLAIIFLITWFDFQQNKPWFRFGLAILWCHLTFQKRSHDLA